MLRLLKIEFHKIFYNRTSLIILGMYLLLLAPVAFGLDNLLNSARINVGGTELNPLDFTDFSLFKFPKVWHNMAFLASCFQFLLAVVVISLVTNEFTFKTLRQNIIDGMSKWEIIWAKELVILCITIFAVLVMLVLTLVLGKNPDSIGLFTGMEYVLAFFLSLFLYLNFAYLLSSLIKRPGLVIGLLLLYSLVLERIITYKLPEQIQNLFPMAVVGNFIPMPFGKYLGMTVEPNLSPLNLGLWFFYICLFIGLNYWLLKRGHAGK